jgi:hypothetical protein
MPQPLFSPVLEKISPHKLRLSQKVLVTWLRHSADTNLSDFRWLSNGLISKIFLVSLPIGCLLFLGLPTSF